ncbi:MAG TPA: CBS domain-containing protein [Candidatus Angelobacter sp.]|jgi:CBS domain-containing protein/sporulation protein YlmC with PRC-barrel domain|nr:CBS domain-containing protein [Candidatus Angelobacter sp.]
MQQIALSSIIGAPVYDNSGELAGHVREVAIAPQDDPNHISDFIVRSQDGDRMVPLKSVLPMQERLVRTMDRIADWPHLVSWEGLLLLERDLLDQQIIDVHGRKVVRVNDVDLHQELSNGNLKLKIEKVDVGLRGAVRRLLKGLAPMKAIEALVVRLPERTLPWEFVNLIETDPARRVHLKLEYERLSKLHPADIADILEELSPAEREAVFGSLNEEVAAGALEEIDPKLQVELMSSIDSDKAADIVEEMGPDAAADLLGDLPQETSEEILEEMEPEEREEVSELLAFEENTAAGHMTNEYLALPPDATVADAINRLRQFEGATDTISTIFLVDSEEKLVGAVPLVALVLGTSETKLSTLSPEHTIFCEADVSESEVAEMFDKYNLQSLPVIDEKMHLAGIITADDVISILRSKV